MWEKIKSYFTKCVESRSLYHELDRMLVANGMKNLSKEQYARLEYLDQEAYIMLLKLQLGTLNLAQLGSMGQDTSKTRNSIELNLQLMGASKVMRDFVVRDALECLNKKKEEVLVD